MFGDTQSLATAGENWDFSENYMMYISVSKQFGCHQPLPKQGYINLMIN